MLDVCFNVLRCLHMGPILMSFDVPKKQYNVTPTNEVLLHFVS